MSGLPPSMDEERLKALFEAYVNPSGGRTLEELLKSKDKLKGAEAQRLRGHFSSYCLHPADCQDPIFVANLMTGRLKALQQRWEDDIKEATGSVEAARIEWENFRDSPNQLPIVDILQIGAWTQLSNVKSIPERYYECLEFLTRKVGMSVEGTDIAGNELINLFLRPLDDHSYTALQHSLTCTPLLHDFKWSSFLLQACPDPITAINHRNRYGTTSMHEASMTLMRPGETEIRANVLRWLLEHGANADVLDGDHCSPRSTGGRVPQFKEIIQEFDQVQIKTEACGFCRRGGFVGKGKAKDAKSASGEANLKERTQGGDEEAVPLKANLRCGRCRARNYCGAACQKMDWAAHKKQCVAFASNAPSQREVEAKATSEGKKEETTS
ncbi:BZ3500_MvSof-1268-A1-R1_Chr4-3g07365 [Microbotryum saponariae]|uniref:BZ3500_MvSof-1268-A1-R1_Chr4-3g07365 protein n=1 Tax=Microbotryum saponariae TaxID=289078 RepID=A0A2X0LNZ5_9BASI|nr:BZ3500_MvSof-1268-A1-R1_Chr4-3g07365 [Microbotryum saponariae]SDA07028.1 BZ3501_MvSof-1269-A2-R1_Chr4-2g07074 [Microbotryum saponariae]